MKILFGKNYVPRLEMTAPVFALTHLDSSYRPDRIGMCFWLTQDVEVNFVLF